MGARGGTSAPHATPGERAAALPTIAIEDAGSTPILREYRAVKARHPDALLLARLGDFYEIFGADAELAAPILGVTLTGRGFGNAGRLPMCGVPHHAAGQYIRRLLDAGLRVALWDQVGEVVPGRLVRREVTRVISPGTVIEAEYLVPGRAARCVALVEEGVGGSTGARGGVRTASADGATASAGGRASAGARGRVVGIAAFDASTGELLLSEVPGGLDAPAVAEECERIDAAELVVEEGSEAPESLLPGVTRSPMPPSVFAAERAAERLRAATGAVSLEGLGIAELPAACSAAGAVLAYCERSRIVLSPGFVRVRSLRESPVMCLDPPTVRNLELLSSQSGTGLAVVHLLDHTRTPMGARLLRARLREPLVDAAELAVRLNAVARLVEARDAREALRGALTGVRDLERLTGRCVQGIASPRDLAAIREACASLPPCRDAVESMGRPGPGARGVPREGTEGRAAGDASEAAAARCQAPPEVLEHLGTYLVADPPATARDGGVIRPEADGELHRLIETGSEARAYLAGLEAHERERTGIRSLRVGYNRVFGYYIEIPNAHRDGAPADYVRKQTLAGSERYITPDLKEREAIVLTARDRAIAREQELIRDCCALVAAHAGALLDAASAAAVLDVTQSLAVAADQEAWTRPELSVNRELTIEDGRHPLVERTVGRSGFVANDTHLGEDGGRIVILTGPNMAGKSTYLRQVALITLLAQIGSFVPAGRAHIGVCDRIFTRIGARDDLAAGLSTFMVEMAETATILHQATPQSLVILDEIGRGTSTYDGLSIAQAVVEHLHDAPHLGCRTLFATHYHELTALERRLPAVRNARVEVLEQGESITFLHRIVPGGADRSYGIHVARLAGLPGGVVARARRLLEGMERERPLGGGAPSPDQLVLGLAQPQGHPMLTELAQLDLDGLTPRQALDRLAEWQQGLERR